MRTSVGILVAGLLAIGLGSAAWAAPVAVTYGFAAPWSISTASGGGASTGQGTLTVVYASGTAAIGGARVGPLSASIEIAGTGSPITLLGSLVPGWQAGPVPFAGLLAPRTSIFWGPSSIDQPPTPPVALTAATIGTAPWLGASIAFRAFGRFSIGSGAITGTWAIGSLPSSFAHEIARTSLPEPSLGMLLAGVLAALGLVTAAAGRRARA